MSSSRSRSRLLHVAAHVARIDLWVMQRAAAPVSGSPDKRCSTVSVVMQAPLPSAIARTISAVSTLLRFRLHSASRDNSQTCGKSFGRCEALTPVPRLSLANVVPVVRPGLLTNFQCISCHFSAQAPSADSVRILDGHSFVCCRSLSETIHIARDRTSGEHHLAGSFAQSADRVGLCRGENSCRLASPAFPEADFRHRPEWGVLHRPACSSVIAATRAAHGHFETVIASM